ncbi:unnamed protein product [Blepharisma stoltei]|uniref:Uncharacterized protein n=1 Tax=Blepharisma stoltei TaxID=1481888 RepID=A0AAU9IY09_9CILI|nr:unnamed protein product [Blepharisma stoltei]
MLEYLNNAKINMKSSIKRPQSAASSKEVKQFFKNLKKKKEYYAEINENLIIPTILKVQKKNPNKEDIAKEFLKAKINQTKIAINEQLSEISSLKVQINKCKFWNPEKTKNYKKTLKLSQNEPKITTEQNPYNSVIQAKEKIEELRAQIEINEKIILQRNQDIIRLQSKIEKSPSVLKLTKHKEKVKTMIEKGAKELEIRKNMENLLIKGYDHRSGVTTPMSEKNKVMNVLNTLENWDSAPEIVKKHVIEQKNAINDQEKEINELERQLEERRKNFIHSEFQKILEEKENLWKKEWEERIESDIAALKRNKEMEINNLKFQKKMIEIEIAKEKLQERA